MRSPIFELMRMNAADTKASRAMADWTPLAVVWRSVTTAEIDTFMNEVSTTRTNIAAANRSASRGFDPPSTCTTSSGSGVMRIRNTRRVPMASRGHCSGRQDLCLLGIELGVGEDALRLE